MTTLSNRRTLVGAAKTAAKTVGVRRSRLASARMCCERNVLATVRRPGPLASRILCYHSIGTPEWGVNDVSPAQFRQHIELALREGYRFVPADTIANGEASERDLAITFDVGLASVANAIPVLTEYHIPWTLFVVSGWADGTSGWREGIFMDWDAIERAAAAGAQLGSHSVSHPDFAGLSAETAEFELRTSRRTMADRIGVTPSTFAIPLGQSGNWTPRDQTAALTAGYTQIYAQSEARRPKGTVPRTFITRFDSDRIFRAALTGKFDRWEEWV